MSWAEALSDFETKIAEAELNLREGQPFSESVLQPFVPPADLGPFPSELAEWATAILARNAELTQTIGDAMISLEAEMATTSKEVGAAKRYYPTAQTTVSQYFDKPV